MLKIYLEEEYGYRHWRWDYPGTKTELIADWKAGKAPFMHPKQPYAGEIVKMSYDEVEVHNLNPKYEKLWVRRSARNGIFGKDVFNTPEYKALQKQFSDDLHEKWPIHGHVFLEDDTYLIVDRIRYIPEHYEEEE